MEAENKHGLSNNCNLLNILFLSFQIKIRGFYSAYFYVLLYSIE